MLIVDLARRVKREFGDEYTTFINDDDVYNWIFDAETEIIRISGNEKTINANANTFPASIASNISVKRLVLDGRTLTYIDRQDLDAQDISVETPISTNNPQYWFVVDGKVFVYPPTSLTSVITVYYNKMPVLTTGPPPSPTTMTVPESFHNDVMKYCLARAHGKNHDSERERYYMEQFEKNTGLRANENDAADVPLFKAADPMDYTDYAGMY